MKRKTLFDTGKEKLVFDAVFLADYLHVLNITDHPVQSGANISDHAYLEADVLTFEIGMSDVMKSIIPGQFSGGSSRSINAYKKIRELQEQRLPISVTTKFGTYRNMLVETLAVPDDSTTMEALKATVILKQTFVVNVKTVRISARPQKNISSNNGDQKALQADQSILYKIINGFR